MAGKRILSLVGLVVVFAVAYGFQRLLTHMKTELGVTASSALGKGIFWVDSIALVVLAAMLLLLGWYVVSRVSRDVWLGAVFTVMGLFLTFVTAVEWSLEKPWLSYRMTMATLVAPGSYGHYVAAFALVVGIACLVAPKRRRR